ncbi:MAG: NADH-quinone oxidoreductase subunit C [Endomicrobia bacterium]|nr:NADH-quinone oxidoreductase subunit C [Endomicrobiia bacterium]MCX7940990.1 NADH-quinone oxidoreductase subunit C [Endomicrobiia bacterium]MDW8056008.1 NADH-quinone oxidoreductase subunit C [Elusimicrobiota bacterium]
MGKNIIEEVKEKFGDKIVDFFIKNNRRCYIEIKPQDIIECAKILFEEMNFRFATATGIDCEKHLEILYHFSYDKTGIIVSLRVKLDKKNPEIESLTQVFTAAEWIEREIWEMLGVNFKGHPNLKHLLLPDDWPEGKHPLRE